MRGFLDSFEIVGLAGEGAMAKVWHAVHRELRTPVALKVIAAEFASDENFQIRFAREVRLVSRLNVRGIVRLYDHGILPDAVPAYLKFPLEPSTPYCLMEWIPGGTLHDRLGNMQWTELRATLLCLLESLASAHSNLIIHRDLKPRNVLMADRGPVISDFGIAYGQDLDNATGDAHAFVGTPNYMSPEQIRGDWRAFGPWTDLYALGCLTYAVLCGMPPFPAKSLTDSIEGHLRASVPVLRPLVPVPSGLDEWIGRLMAKRPQDRFQLAADAALALLEFPDEIPLVDHLGHQVGVWHEGEDTVVAPPVFVPVTDTEWATAPVVEGRPGLPSSWALPSDIRSGAPLPGLGRSLFNLSAAPFCGRLAERDQLWQKLRHCIDYNELQIVLIQGNSGVGKTILSRWIGRRAHEVGAALPIFITHQNPQGDQCGLRGVVNRIFQCGHLDLDERSIRIESQAEAMDLGHYSPVFESMAGGLGSTIGAAEPTVLYTLSERFEAVSQLLRNLAAKRPRVLVIDDGQWGSEALSFARFLRRRHRDMPVLVLVTVRQDVLVRQSPSAKSIERLLSHEDTLDIRLGPLSSSAHRELLESRLILDPEVVAYLEERTHGNPLFTEELVRHWIRSEVLEPGPRGFRLRSQTDRSIPDTIYGVWAIRINQAFGGTDEGFHHSVQLAAVLGHRVSVSEWKKVCQLAGVPHSSRIIDRLHDEQMIDSTHEHEFEFTHVLLRESLLRTAHEQGQLVRWHHVCADVLGSMDEVAPSRLGEHLFSAKRYHEAEAKFAEAALLYGNVSDYSGAEWALIRWGMSLRRAGVSQASEQWLLLRLRWVVCKRVQGHRNSARRHIDKNVRLARGLAFHEQTVLSLLEYTHHVKAEAYESALNLVDEALGLCQAVPKHIHMRAMAVRGRILTKLRRNDEAKSAFTTVLDCESASITSRIESALGLARLCEIDGDYDGTLVHSQAANRWVEESKSRWEKAHCKNTLGDALRKLGRLDEAEVVYRYAADLLTLIGNVDAWACYANIGLVMIELGRYPQAHDAFSTALTCPGVREDASIQASLETLRLLADTFLQEWTAWDTRFALLEKITIWDETQYDVAMAAARTANEATRLGQIKRGQMAWRLALRIFDALGLSERGREHYANRYVFEV